MEHEILYFSNAGDFDVRAMTTFGVNAKENDDAIGYFGTGFKYAIAIVLRLGGSIRVETNGQTIKFEARREIIRGKEFDVVYKNGVEAGFTTRLGVNWQPWMAFRELYCNCTDEGGKVTTHHVEADTVVIVDCPLIYESWLKKDDYFISGTPIDGNHELDIYEGWKPFIFYRGVAVRNIEMSSFSYNIKKKIDLTEDRSVSYPYQVNDTIKHYLQQSKNHEILNKVVAKNELFEQHLGFDRLYGASEEFLQVCASMEKTEKGISLSATKLLQELRLKNAEFSPYYLTKIELQMLERAKLFLYNMGISIDDFPIKTVEGLGTGVLGMAKNKIVYLSPLPFELGTKQVASTLLEEWVHNKTGADDFDRRMQNWLFDKVLSLGEELNGSPL